MDSFKNLASVEEEDDDDEEDDEDYVPSKEDLENDDDADKDGDSSDSDGDSDADSDEGGSKKKRRGRKRKASASKDDTENVSGDHGKELTSEEKKKKADDLWAELNSTSPIKPEVKPATVTQETGEAKVVEKVYDFAGEKVVVKEATKPITSSSSSSIGQSSTPSSVPGIPTVRRSGLKDLVSNLGKKNKIGTLQKSKIDWDSFKRDQGIEDELKQATLSKDGYVERQAFLSRADVRQFEIEKSIRSKIRKPQ